ncbi:hypothetical protein [Streptomyces daliensis]|uniref:Uncharacterized protein n=1 Tax=Streptomyces daliensis TaxID=299421 RepID=A0A8T4IYC8_9ACTN|nr:hypothetical protein [Streptomyces daliensis]
MQPGGRTSTSDAVRDDAEQAASALAQHLRAGGALTPLPVPDLPLAEGEHTYADVTCMVARFYGTEVAYPARAGYFEDHPAFGRRWVSNRRLDARRRLEAEAAAEEQWRDHVSARVVLTSTGLRLLPSGEQKWLPFDHAFLTGVQGGSEIVLTYSVCAPLLLAGPAAPWLGVAVDHLEGSSHTP